MLLLGAILPQNPADPGICEWTEESVIRPPLHGLGGSTQYLNIGGLITNINDRQCLDNGLDNGLVLILIRDIQTLASSTPIPLAVLRSKGILTSHMKREKGYIIYHYINIVRQVSTFLPLPLATSC